MRHLQEYVGQDRAYTPTAAPAWAQPVSFVNYVPVPQFGGPLFAGSPIGGQSLPGEVGGIGALLRQQQANGPSTTFLYLMSAFAAGVIIVVAMLCSAGTRWICSSRQRRELRIAARRRRELGLSELPVANPRVPLAPTLRRPQSKVLTLSVINPDDSWAVAVRDLSPAELAARDEQAKAQGKEHYRGPSMTDSTTQTGSPVVSPHAAIAARGGGIP